MSKYVISYNPYNNTTIVEKDGVKLRKNSAFCNGLNGKRLQSWFDETSRWDGIGKVIDDDNNEKTCEIIFRGREIDYIDLRDYFNHFYKSKRGTKFELSAENLSSDEDMLARLRELVEEAREKELFSEKQLEEIEKHFEDLQTQPFIISVIATMSSGKSTLLNAMMHKELLPTGDKATTANIVEIYDNDANVIKYCAYDAKGKIIKKGDEADATTFREINENSKVRMVKIWTDIPMVSAGSLPLMLRDTPGPNNSDDKSHRQLTDSIIEDAHNMSTVLYVMNATQLRVDSDYDLLESIADEMKKGGKQANDRFLFVINRVDDWTKDPNQTLEGLVAETKDYLKKFDIENPRIFLTTAALASNVWKERNGGREDFSPREKKDYDHSLDIFSDPDDPTIRFENFAGTSQFIKEKIKKELKSAEEREDRTEMAIIHSGVKGLEYSIEEYMEKYAYPIKVSEAVDDIIKSIDDKKMRLEFEKKIREDEKQLKVTKERIEEIRKKKEKGRKRGENSSEKSMSISFPNPLSLTLSKTRI